MKVSVLSHDLSTNALGRAHVLARLLHEHHDVEIVGPALSGAVWAPLRGDTTVPLRVIPDTDAAAMATQVSGDLLYSVKELPTSLGVALEAQRQRPAATDRRHRRLGAGLPPRIDPGDVPEPLPGRDKVGRPDAPGRPSATLVLARGQGRPSRRRADAITVSSTWLAKRFGGTVIEHARDTSISTPPCSTARRRGRRSGCRPPRR